jgi:tRNA A22 N-methylase
MSGKSSMAHNVTLTGPIQIKIDNVIQANTAAINKEQLRNHIQEVHKGLIALTQLPTTNRLYELLSVQQSAKDAEAQILVSQKELALTQQMLKEMEGKTPECDYRELKEKVRNLE